MSHTNKPPTMGGMIEYAGTTQQLNRPETSVTLAKSKQGDTTAADEVEETTITVRSEAVQTKIISWVGGKPNDSWTQLEDPDAGPASPHCCRTVDPAANEPKPSLVII